MWPIQTCGMLTQSGVRRAEHEFFTRTFAPVCSLWCWHVPPSTSTILVDVIFFVISVLFRHSCFPHHRTVVARYSTGSRGRQVPKMNAYKDPHLLFRLRPTQRIAKSYNHSRIIKVSATKIGKRHHDDVKFQRTRRLQMYLFFHFLQRHRIYFCFCSAQCVNETGTNILSYSEKCRIVAGFDIHFYIDGGWRRR